jgi:glycosyltransferase involved in cell wall biosynthesis
MIFWNAERFIQEAVESVLAQSSTDWELILMDDGSTDAGTQIAQHYAARFPDRIYYVEHEGHSNRGMSASRNAGIRRTSGRYVAFLDADDAWLPNKLERQVAILNAFPAAAMVYGASRYWHSWTGAEEDIGKDHVPDLGVAPGLYSPPSLLTRLYPFGPETTPPPSDFMVRREVIDAVGGFEESFRGIHQLYDDQAFLVKMYRKAGIYVSDEVWDNYRIHPDSCDANSTRGGHYDSIRGFFLNWYSDHLKKEGVQDQAIWRMLGQAIHAARVQLRTGNGKSATLQGMRVVIEPGPLVCAADVQVNLPFYPLLQGNQYLLSFRVRADRPRALVAGISAAHAPWLGLGLYEHIQVNEVWQDFRLPFLATATDDNARIHFDLGEDEASVELSHPVLFLGDEVVAPWLQEVNAP